MCIYWFLHQQAKHKTPSYVSENVQQSVVASVLAQLTDELRKENQQLALGIVPKKKRSLRPRKHPPSHRFDTAQGRVERVEGRLGMSTLTGKAALVLREWSPSTFNLPDNVDVEVEMTIGGRRWLVKDSTLGGYGLFACEDIPVPANLGHDMQYAPALFPYAGPVYTAKEWRVLVRENPSWKMYQLDMDKWPGSHKRHEHSRTIDGDPMRYPNIAGYINSTQGTKPQLRENVE